MPRKNPTGHLGLNPGRGPKVTAPDAHGQAALLLCETLTHLLIERNVLTLDEVCRAIEGIEDIAEEMVDRAAIEGAKTTLTLLRTIRLSLLSK